MRRLIKVHGPCGLEPKAKRSPYEALVNAVAHQQLHANAAQAILKRFCALYPSNRFPKPEQLLATEDATLRAAGFSFSKIAAIRDIAAKTSSGLIPTLAKAAKLSDEELITRLIEVRGVGRWTVEMLLIFTLGRRDILPVDDFGVREGWRLATRADAQLKPKALAAIGEAWAPYRSVAAWYLWRASDAGKKVKQAA